MKIILFSRVTTFSFTYLCYLKYYSCNDLALENGTRKFLVTKYLEHFCKVTNMSYFGWRDMLHFADVAIILQPTILLTQI